MILTADYLLLCTEHCYKDFTCYQFTYSSQKPNRHHNFTVEKIKMIAPLN